MRIATTKEALIHLFEREGGVDLIVQEFNRRDRLNRIQVETIAELRAAAKAAVYDWDMSVLGVISHNSIEALRDAAKAAE